MFSVYDTIQLYMVMGGVPHYLEKIKKGDSIAQNIDRLCFNKDGILHGEFNQLYASLFDDSTKHLSIINALASVKKGIPRNILIKKSSIISGGGFSLKLEELIESGFVSEYIYFGNKAKQTLYRLSDEYSLFYLKYIKNNKNNGADIWQQLSNTPSYNSWSGFSFKSVSLKHIEQIKKGLGIQSIYSTNSSWYSDNAQIDLVIDRADNIITICELKFSQQHFSISKSYYENLRKKITEFKLETKTRKNVFLTMVTTFGVQPNPYSSEIMEKKLTLNCLFEEGLHSYTSPNI